MLRRFLASAFLALAFVAAGLAAKADLSITDIVGLAVGTGHTGPPTLTYITRANDTANQTIYTFSAVNISSVAAANDRLIIVGIDGVAGTAPNSAISSVTVGGITAQVVGNSGGSIAPYLEIWVAAVPEGTSVDIVVTFGESQSRAGISVWGATGIDATATDTDAANSASANSIAISALTVPTGGFAVAVCGTTATGGVTTWTNMTERNDALLEALNEFTAADTTTAGTNTITCDDGNSLGYVIFGAAWGP